MFSLLESMLPPGPRECKDPQYYLESLISPSEWT